MDVLHQLVMGIIHHKAPHHSKILKDITLLLLSKVFPTSNL
jgi:hypothetical protein